MTRGKPENLKPWKKGESGNPNGRPVRKPIEQFFQDFLYEKIKNAKGEERDRLSVLTERLFIDGAKGNSKASQEVLNRAFGRAQQTIRHEGDITLSHNRESVVERFLARRKK